MRQHFAGHGVSNCFVFSNEFHELWILILQIAFEDSLLCDVIYFIICSGTNDHNYHFRVCSYQLIDDSETGGFEFDLH